MTRIADIVGGTHNITKYFYSRIPVNLAAPRLPGPWPGSHLGEPRGAASVARRSGQGRLRRMSIQQPCGHRLSSHGRFWRRPGKTPNGRLE